MQAVKSTIQGPSNLTTRRLYSRSLETAFVILTSYDGEWVQHALMTNGTHKATVNLLR